MSCGCAPLVRAALGGALSYRPPLATWILSYDRSLLIKDLSAGFAVFVLLIPQGLAYALLGGLPPIYGLYAAGVPLLVYTVFATSRQLAIGDVLPVLLPPNLVTSSTSTLAGPMAIASLLSGSVVGALRNDDGSLLKEESADWVEASIALAVLTGALLVLLGLLGAHRLTRGLSGSVLSGFTTGVACVIFLSQLPKLLGLSLERRPYSHQTLVDICLNLPDLNVLALLVGLSTAAALQAVKVWRQRYVPPATGDRTRWTMARRYLHASSRFSLLAAGLVTTVLSWAVHNYSQHSMPIIGSVPRGLPSPQLPPLSPSLLVQLLPGAFMLAVITFAGNWAVAKKFAEKNNYTVEGGAEMMAYGIANMVGSVFHSYVVAGGFARSAVNAEGGAQTPLAGFMSGMCMLIALQFFTSIFYYLPLATLGAIIVVSVVTMMDFRRILFAYQKGFRRDCLVMLGTVLCTFFAGVTMGLLCGVALSVAVLLLSTSSTEFSSQCCVPLAGGDVEFADPTPPDHHEKSFHIVHMSTLLYFGNLEVFKEAVRAEARTLAQVLRNRATNAAPGCAEKHELGAVVVDASCWGHYLELPCAAAIEELRQDLLVAAAPVTLTLGMVNCHPEVLKLLAAIGTVESIGTDMIYSSTEDCLRNCELRLRSRLQDKVSEGAAGGGTSLSGGDSLSGTPGTSNEVFYMSIESPRLDDADSVAI